jgi:hypothetical protein
MIKTTAHSFVALIIALLQVSSVTATWKYAQPGRFPDVPADGPKVTSHERSKV